MQFSTHIADAFGQMCQHTPVAEIDFIKINNSIVLLKIIIVVYMYYLFAKFIDLTITFSHN